MPTFVLFAQALSELVGKLMSFIDDEREVSSHSFAFVLIRVSRQYSLLLENHDYVLTALVHGAQGTLNPSFGSLSFLRFQFAIVVDTIEQLLHPQSCASLLLTSSHSSTT